MLWTEIHISNTDTDTYTQIEMIGRDRRIGEYRYRYIYRIQIQIHISNRDTDTDTQIAMIGREALLNVPCAGQRV